MKGESPETLRGQGMGVPGAPSPLSTEPIVLILEAHGAPDLSQRGLALGLFSVMEINGFSFLLQSGRAGSTGFVPSPSSHGPDPTGLSPPRAQLPLSTRRGTGGSRELACVFPSWSSGPAGAMLGVGGRGE